MSKDILIRDNFINNMDELRDIALSLEFLYHMHTPVQVGWRGYRTWELSHHKNPLIDDCHDKVLKESSKFFNLDKDSIAMEMYFHITYEKHGYQQIRKWHKDDRQYAGIIYMNHNAPLNGGTTIFLDGKGVEVENKYNRLVLYSGKNKHGPTNLFGDDKNSGRMTFTFFIGDKKNTTDQINHIDNLREARGRGELPVPSWLKS